MPSRWLWRRSGRRTERISSTAPKRRHVFDDIFHIFVIFLIHFVLSIEVFCSHEDKMPHELPSEWVELSLYMFFLRNSSRPQIPGPALLSSERYRSTPSSSCFVAGRSAFVLLCTSNLPGKCETDTTSRRLHIISLMNIKRRKANL